MSYENWKIEKWRIWENPDADDQQAALDEYADVAAWCNDGCEYTIIDDNEYYIVVKVEPEPQPEPEPEVSDNEIIENLE